MNRLMALALMLALMLGVAGCGGDTHESLAGEAVSTMKQLLTALETVKDEASATAAKDTLKSLVQKLNDINQRQAKLPAPTEADVKAMDSKYGKEMEQLQQKFTGQMMRIQFDPKISSVLDGIDMKPGR
jgi:hypothetical protein